MNNKERLDLRIRLNRMNPVTVFMAVTGRSCSITEDEGYIPVKEDEPQGAQWHIDVKHKTIKCARLGLGGNNIQWVMDVKHKDEISAGRELVNCYNDWLNKELTAARSKNKDCDDVWTSKEIDLTKYDGEPEKEPHPYYEPVTVVRRQILEEVLHECQRELWRDSETSKAAIEFCKSRGWDEKILQTWDLGYCDWHTIDSKVDEFGWSRNELYAMGILNHGEKGDTDRLHGRIIIPVYDRFGSVCGYTSRILKCEEERQLQRGIKPSKYMAAPEPGGWLEEKSKNMFGLNRSTYSGAITSSQGCKIYIAEGNPDIMRLHSIGIDNAAAPMGTGFNDKTWKLLNKARVQTICFIPDLDVPDEGEMYGTGIKKVMENGKTAIKEGFNVFVKELPWPKTKTVTTYNPDTDRQETKTVENKLDRKVDVDDWFNPMNKDLWTKIAKWDDMPEKNFILWYADKKKAMLPENPTPEERNAWTIDIAEMIVCMPENLRDDYINDLIAINRAVNKAKWKEACKMHIGQKRQAEIKKSQKSKGNLSNYGIEEVNGCYYLQGGDEPFTNFVLEPKYYVERWGDSHWICRAISENDRIRVVDYDNDILTSSQKFKSSMASLAMRVKIGKSGNELDSLFAYISDNSQEVKKIEKLGWQPSIGVWSWGNGVTVPGDKKFYESNEYGVSDYGNEVHVYIPSAAKISGMDESSDADGYDWERSLRYDKLQSWDIKTVFKQICHVYGYNGGIAIMFLVASIFRDVVVKYSKGFPVLSCYGPRGSGKSSLGQTLTSFFSTSSSMMITLGESTSDSALDLLLGHAQNIIVHIDEYKNTIKESQIAIIKAIWDGEGRSVRNMNTKNKSSQKTKVRCGVVLSGQEVPNIEAAMFSRFLPCEFVDDKKRQKETAEDYEKLVNWQSKGFSYLTAEILEHRQEFEDDFQMAWDECTDTINNMLGDIQILPRIKNNWTALLASYFCLSRHDWWPFHYADAKSLVLKKIIEQSRMSDHSDERADFWKTFALCVGSLRIRKGAHYKIKSVHSLVYPNENTRMTEDKKKVLCRTIEKARATCERVLLIRYDDVYPIIRAFARNTGEESKLMDSGSMKLYINKTSEGYIGETPLETFADVDKDGRAVYGRDANGNTRLIKNRKAGVMMFAYDQIANRYDIDLENVMGLADMNETDTEKEY